MAASESATIHKIPKVDQDDLISSLPTDLTDNILKFLPLKSVAQMSVLSKKWKQNWLSHRYLVFDREFWVGQRTSGKSSWQTISNLINSILLHHIGPIHEFILLIPIDVVQVTDLDLNQWLSFLSRIGIKKINLDNHCGRSRIPIPSHIFICAELEELRIVNCKLMQPPTDFKGFACLRRLKLWEIEFQHADTFGRLLENCPRLKTLILWNIVPCSLLIDVPSLKHLNVINQFEPCVFKDSPHLESIFLLLSHHKRIISDEKITGIANFLLASSSELQRLTFKGDLCKILAAGGITKRFSFAFSHLVMLHLENLDLGDFEVFCFTVGMIQSSPFIKDLKISVSLKRSVGQHQYDFNDNFELRHLRKAEINNIEGTTAELKFIEYVLAISVMLEKLFLKCSNLEPSSKLKVSHELLQLPRASRKAKVIF